MAKSKDKKPNILMIISDQLNPRVIGKYKEFYDFSHLEADVTPNIDNLAENGVLFESVYTPTPLCRPARAAFWTGLFPHQTNVFTNGKMFKDPKVKSDVPSVGSVFSQHGYETKHIGKRHDHGALHGFDYSLYGSKKVDEEHPAWPVNQDTYRDVYTTKKSVDFLNEYPEDGNPFFLVSDLCNPHNICGWVGENKGPHDDIDPPIELPPLPDNFEIDDIENRPEAIQYICCSHRRMKQASQWAKENYRHYLAAYLHYTQRLDRDVGEILEALEKRGDMDNTLIIFMADHGDGCASHRLVTKQVSLYDETTRVPMIVMGKGIEEKGKKVSERLVSLLDLFPTLCEYADIDPPKEFWGKSILPWTTKNGEGKENCDHPYVVSQWHSEWGFTISPGRMIRTQDFKYIRYIENGDEELYDMKNDPGETKNLADENGYEDILKRHRILLDEYLEKTEDPFFRMKARVDKRWRSHELGYMNHEGSCAPGYKKWLRLFKRKKRLSLKPKKE